MFNINTLRTELIGLIGWRQGRDPLAQSIEGLTDSETGLMYNDEHPVLTQDNLESVAPFFSKMVHPTWSGSVTYAVGTLVTYTSVVYISIKEGLNKQPNTEVTYWEVYKPFRDWLKMKTEAGITRALNDWIKEKKIERTSRTVFEDKYLFEGAGRILETIPSTGKVVGFELNLRRSGGVMGSLVRVGVQFATNGTFNLYLFNSGKKEPVKTKEIVYTGAGNVQWIDLTEWTIGYDAISPGSAYYVAYHQDTAPVAINGGRDFANLMPCEDCGRGAYRNWELVSKYFEVHPFAVEGTEGVLPDIMNNSYTYTQNYGLNLQVSVYCDLTQFILRQRNVFAPIISKQVAIMMMREIAHGPNSRVNMSSGNINRDMIMFDLDNPAGMLAQYEKELKAVRLETEGLDVNCLPCKKQGVRVRMI
jgi:hypothetical protein